MTTAVPYLLVAAGGAIGSVSRYAFFRLFQDFEHKHIFFGVLTVNIIGSFLIGIALGFAVKEMFFERGTVSHFLFITGFLGSFTTFSTFSQDNIKLLFLDNNILGVFLNSGVNLLGGLLTCGIGYFLIARG
jgi:CrcB protein